MTIEGIHAIDGRRDVIGCGFALLERGCDQAHTQRLRQDQLIADLCAAFGEDVRRMHDAVTARPILRLGVGDGVPADDDRAGFAHFLRAAAQDLGQDRTIEIFGKGR